MNILLQIPSLGIFETLAQYGVLGILTLGMGMALWYLLKRQISSEDKLKNRVDELQKELTDYIKNDQNQIKSTIDNNTKALHELRELIMLNAINHSNFQDSSNSSNTRY